MLLVQNAYLGNKLILETLKARSGVWQACAPQLVGIKTEYPTEQLRHMNCIHTSYRNRHIIALTSKLSTSKVTSKCGSAVEMPAITACPL